MEPKAILDQIRPWITELIHEHGLELVDLSWQQGTILRVLLDGPGPVNLQSCAQVSRQLGEKLEEQAIISFAYTLEVGTPGLDWPLTRPVQFQRNLDRRLKVLLNNGETLRGKLKEAEETRICLAWEKGEISKGRKRVEDRIIELTQIKRAVVEPEW